MSTTRTDIAVPLLDLKTQYALLKSEIMPEIESILDSQYLIGGPPLGAFEGSAAAYCEARHAVGCSSGTDALILALMALCVGPGDEVITTPYTFFATAGSIWRVGAKPVFVDINPQTFNIDAKQIEAAITNKTKAIMPVHLFGQCAEMDPIIEIAGQHGLHVIEDAAQAIGATYLGRRAGTIGTVGCFSFYPTKNLGGLGDGGMCTTNDADLAETMTAMRTHGAKRRYYHDLVGGNFRLDALNAAYLDIKLRYLDRWHEGRRRNAEYYDAELAHVGGVTTPWIHPDCESIYNQYVIRAQRRDELRQYLTDHNIGSDIYYPVSLHEQACFASLGYTTDAFPESSKAAAESLAIPVYPEMNEAQLHHVVDKIKAFYATG